MKEEGEDEYTLKIGDSKNSKIFKVSYTGDMTNGFVITNEDGDQETPVTPPTTEEGGKETPDTPPTTEEGGKETPDTPPTTEGGSKETPNNPPKENNKGRHKGGRKTTKTRDIEVTKHWIDNEGKKIVPPVEKTEVELYKNGVATGIKKELNKENSWTATFDKLKISETSNGKENEYTIKEVGGESGNIKVNDKNYTVVISGTMEDGYVITSKTDKIDIPTIKPNDPKPNDPQPNIQESYNSQSNIQNPSDSKTDIKEYSQNSDELKDTKEVISPNTSKQGKALPKTGDTSDPMLYSFLIGIVGIVLLLAGHFKKKYGEEEKAK